VCALFITEMGCLEPVLGSTMMIACTAVNISITSFTMVVMYKAAHYSLTPAQWWWCTKQCTIV